MSFFSSTKTVVLKIIGFFTPKQNVGNQKKLAFVAVVVISLIERI